MPVSLVVALKAHKAHQIEERLLVGEQWQDSGLVFTSTVGTPLEPRNVNRQFDGLLKKAGLAHIRFHDLRHTAASLRLAQGVHPRVVMEILGHSKISVTMDTYSHVIPALNKEAANRIEELLNGTE
jgi:integrase